MTTPCRRDPADIKTNDMYAPQSLPDTVRVLGPTTAEAANKPLTFTQPFYPDQELYLEVRGPGRIRVLINGKDVGERVPLSTTTTNSLLSFWAYQMRDTSSRSSRPPRIRSPSGAHP